MKQETKERIRKELERDNPSAVFLTLILQQDYEAEKNRYKTAKSLPKEVNRSITAACELFGVNPIFVEGLDRKKENITARQFCSLYLTDLGYRDSEVSRFIGKRHRTTTIHSVKKLRDELSVYPDVREQYNEFKQLIESTEV